MTMSTQARFLLSPLMSLVPHASSPSPSLLRSHSRMDTELISPPDLRRRRKLSRLFSAKAVWREVIGIDFGTVNSRVAVMEKNGNPKIIEIAGRERSMPSVVSFDEKGRAIVGDSSGVDENGRADVYGIKRLIGRSYDSDEEQLEKLKKMASYEIIPADSEDEDEVLVKLANGKVCSPTYISSLIIGKLIQEAAKSRENIYASHAVIGVPPSFNDARSFALRQAAERHSICVDLLDESLAASLYHVRKSDRGGRFAVVSFGGGSFDISIVEASNGRIGPNIKRMVTVSDDSLSGLDFDYAVMELLKKKKKMVEKETGGDLSAYWPLLRREAERAKIELFSSPAAEFYINDLEICLERSEFEDSMKGMMLKVEDLCWSCLKEAKMRAREVDEVILVGGMTGAPRVRERVEEIFGKKAALEDNQGEAVALGAAIKANQDANLGKNMVFY